MATISVAVYNFYASGSKKVDITRDGGRWGGPLIKNVIAPGETDVGSGSIHLSSLWQAWD
jgi:hypothetical protein